MFAAEVLGSTDVLDHMECPVPVSIQVERLARALAERFGERCSAVSVDLHGLEGSERDEALNAVVRGDPSPFVLIDGHLSSTGRVDVQAIIATVAAGKRQREREPDVRRRK